jgi:hypothetical protein
LHAGEPHDCSANGNLAAGDLIPLSVVRMPRAAARNCWLIGRQALQQPRLLGRDPVHRQKWPMTRWT